VAADYSSVADKTYFIKRALRRHEWMTPSACLPQKPNCLFAAFADQHRRTPLLETKDS
jgi:hypothetical protein